MVRVGKWVVGAVFGSCVLAAASASRADIPAGMNRFERTEYVVAQDQSYVEVQTLENRVVVQGGVVPLSTAAFTFDPGDETLEVLEAWVLQPDGTRIDVPPGNIFTRPSEAAKAAPGFVSRQTTTIEFPSVQVGSIVHSKFRHTATQRDVFGFNVPVLMGLTANARREVQIKVPAGLPLQFRERGGFVTTDTTVDGIRTIDTRIDVGQAGRAEANMVAVESVGPIFIATALSGYEDMGAIYAARSAGKANVTPEIAALARTIVGDTRGKEAARAIYDWVAEHIRYVAVYLDPGDGFVPHDAASVLRNRYGDCKDHVVLMQALLGAVGIRAEPALINWGNLATSLPLWSPALLNHAIVYLPDFDLYANPTSPYAGFGVLDNGLADKMVIIASAKGEVRRTPALSAAANMYRSNANLTVQADGTVRGAVAIGVAPAIDPDVRLFLESGSSADLVRANLMGTPEGGFGELRYSNPRELSRPLRIDGKWTSPHGVAVTSPSTYMTVPIGIDLSPYGHLSTYFTETGTRTFPFIVNPRDYQSNAHVTLPPGSVIERLPPAVDIRNAAGHVSASYAATPDGFTVIRRMMLDGTVYPPERYPDLAQLIYGMAMDQRAVVVYRAGP